MFRSLLGVLLLARTASAVFQPQCAQLDPNAVCESDLNGSDFTVTSHAVTLGGNVTELGSVIGDATPGGELPTGTSPPACSSGQIYQDTDATAGQRFLYCDGGTWKPFVNLDAVNGHLNLGNGGTAAELQLAEPSGGGTSYTGFKAPALSTNLVYTLPTAQGAAGTGLLNDGAGVLSWGSFGGSFNYYRHVGTTNESRYVAGMVTNSALVASSGTTMVNQLWAMPFLSVRAGVLDRISFRITTAGSGGTINCRVGLYTTTSATNLYPNSLVIDGGDVSASTTGTKDATISQAVSANTLYWAAMSCSNPSTTAMQASMVQPAGQWPILGIDPTGTGTNTYGCWKVARTHAALPSTFTVSAARTTGNCPAVFVRYSS